MAIPDTRPDILDRPAPAGALAKAINFSGTAVEDFFAITIENALSQRECEEILSSVQPAGDDDVPWSMVTFTPHGRLQHMDPSGKLYCPRIGKYMPNLSDALLKRITPFLPLQIATLKDAVPVTGPYPASRGDVWRLSHLGPYLRFLKYGPGHFFRRHCDHMATEGGRDSYLTFLLYLNDEGLSGGATRFHTDPTDPEAATLDVNPKAGSVLVFQQRDLWHEGCEVFQGEKFIVWGNLFYERVVKEGIAIPGADGTRT
ncbi:hypothetical protein DM02DRAFT_183577 [Periconia macrospinosa]|uniref:Prolyl 4-hydroxylase alpha subunit domain-containing protein n=1 Tax=Periconia macrospinosa TaxID=97972 RepID=A0A2V1D9E7_9PLEO|nr:hypothetical protein DM02DRAFT_183577 [Periconia macrospinosa]